MVTCANTSPKQVNPSDLAGTAEEEEEEESVEHQLYHKVVTECCSDAAV